MTITSFSVAFGVLLACVIIGCVCCTHPRWQRDIQTSRDDRLLYSDININSDLQMNQGKSRIRLEILDHYSLTLSPTKRKNNSKRIEPTFPYLRLDEVRWR